MLYDTSRHEKAPAFAEAFAVKKSATSCFMIFASKVL